MYDTITRTVCCLCIPTNIGVPLIITLWIAVSLFFASFSFMNKSPFFSYCNEPATIAFGVINVLFVIVLLYGYTLHIFYRSMNRYRQYAKLFTCFVSVILIDMFANCVLFAVQKEDYIYWCSARSNDEFQKGTAIQLDPQAADSLAFHCNKLHGIEAKFAFLLFTCAVFTFVSCSPLAISLYSSCV
ncbi:hypothetical protein BD408DRAFT_416995 [Parasitella parasitica]|nr:hypothetical protein BD408DRAFT_416995 [Parasitella parasitica]